MAKRFKGSLRLSYWVIFSGIQAILYLQQYLMINNPEKIENILHLQ